MKFQVNVTKLFIFYFTILLIKISNERCLILTKDYSDKIAKKFFVNQDKPQWQRTQAPREEIAIICHILSLGPIECLKYNERESDGANPGHENYLGKIFFKLMGFNTNFKLGLFIQYGMFGAVALAQIKTNNQGRSPNSNIEKLSRIEKNKISEVVNLFQIPKKLSNIQLVESCIFDLETLMFKLVNNAKVELNYVESSIPLDIALKISFHSSYTRELFYTSLLSKQKYPIIPIKTYGKGRIQITPRTYCFKIEENIALNRILITEKINGITLQVLARWLTSYDYLDWISSAKTMKELQKRLDNRAEILWILIHSFFSTLTSLYIHSEFGYLIHCDLNTGNIQIANTSFNPKNSNYQENVDSLLKITPMNIKILDFGTMRSTLEVSIRTLKCNVPNDIWRVKLIVTKLFKIDETTHPNLLGWTADFPKSSLDQSNSLRKNKILDHIKSLDSYREDLMNNGDFKNAIDLNSTFESIIDGLDSICDITVHHISKFKEQAANIFNYDRYYASCSPLDPNNAREAPIRVYKPDVLSLLQTPLFPEKSASIKKLIKEERQKIEANLNNKVNENVKVKDKNFRSEEIKKDVNLNNIEKPAIQGGVSPGGLHGVGIGSASNSNIANLEQNKNDVNKTKRPRSNIVASSIGISSDKNSDLNKQMQMPLFTEDYNLEQEKISQITSLKEVCNYVRQTKSREARKWLNRLKIKNSVLRDMTMDINISVKKADKIIQDITEDIRKKVQISKSDQDRLKVFDLNRSKLQYIAKSCPIALNKIDEENSEATEKVNIGIIAFENERQKILKRCQDLANFVPKNDLDAKKALMKTNEIIERGKTLLQYRFHIQDSMKFAFEFLFKGVRRVQRLVELSRESMKGDLLLEENLELLLDKIAEYKV